MIIFYRKKGCYYSILVIRFNFISYKRKIKGLQKSIKTRYRNFNK